MSDSKSKAIDALIRELAQSRELLELVRIYAERGECSSEASDAAVSIALRAAMPLLARVARCIG